MTSAVPQGLTFAALLVFLLAGCGVLPKSSDIEVRRTPRSGVKPPPIPTRALNVSSDCDFRDPTGYHGMLKLMVADAQVQSFEARVDIPEQGVCRFTLADFRQTETLPNVVLRARGSACIVRMWEQGSRVTVAFNDCADRCSPSSAYPYLWPILAERSGGCG